MLLPEFLISRASSRSRLWKSGTQEEENSVVGGFAWSAIEQALWTVPDGHGVRPVGEDKDAPFGRCGERFVDGELHKALGESRIGFVG